MVQVLCLNKIRKVEDGKQQKMAFFHHTVRRRRHSETVKKSGGRSIPPYILRGAAVHPERRSGVLQSRVICRETVPITDGLLRTHTPPPLTLHLDGPLPRFNALSRAILSLYASRAPDNSSQFDRRRSN